MNPRALAQSPAVRRALPFAGGAVLIGLVAITLLGGENGNAAPQPRAAEAEAAAPVAAKTLSPEERAAIEAVVRQYILTHPEIIPQAISALQNREVAQLLSARRADLETPFGSAWAGAADGDVILVEFYDYGCPFCQQAKADVDRLLAEDKRLKVVYRDFPVLSDASREAALASLSAARQGRHGQFYSAMFGTPGRISHEKVVNGVRQARLNELRTAKDINGKVHAAEIEKNIEIGRALGLTGTPAYVVGDQVLIGAVGYDALKAAIGAARARPMAAAQ